MDRKNDKLVLPNGVWQPVPGRSPWIGDILDATTWAVDSALEGANEAAAKTYGLDSDTKVIVLLVDGLGEAVLERRMSYARTLRNLPSVAVHAQTCLPSTTAAALTCFTTGALPAQTQMVGYSVREGQSTMTLLNFDSGVDPEQWQRVPTKFEILASQGVEVALVTKSRFANSGLTRASFRGATFVGRDTLEDRFDAALSLIARGVSLQVVYWSDIDHVGHKYGPSSPEWAAALEDFDQSLAKFLRRLPKNVNVLLTADHGMIDVKDRIDIAANAALANDVDLIAGEGRAVHLHAAPGRADSVIDTWRNELSDRALVIQKSDLPSVLGCGPGVDRVGDALVLMRDESVVVDSRTQSEASIAQQGVHGSVTWDEMAIPVWRLA